MTKPNAVQRADWNGDSGALWVADADRRDRILAPVLDAVTSAARLEPHEDVLDIGCGCGATTLAAARLLDTGTATGIDLSRPMLELARVRAGHDTRVAFVEGDAQTHNFDGRFDVAISRFGTMFFDDPVIAFRQIRGAIREPGRLCMATWQPLGANEWLSIPGAVLLKYAAAPAADVTGPGMFSQSDQAAIQTMLTNAGWSRVEIEPRETSLRLGADPADAVDYLAGTGVARRLLDIIDPARRPAALAEVKEALRDYMTDGVQLKAGINIIQARA
jgi:SAM-dependent methyltransferase